MTNLRITTPADAAEFAAWVVSNPDIPAADIEAAAQAVTLTVAAEVDGRAELFIPLIFSPDKPQLTVGFLGFRPGQTHRVKANALKVMLEGVRRLRDHFGCEVRVVTKPEYPMGKWAIKHGFTQKQDGFYLETQNVQ